MTYRTTQHVSVPHWKSTGPMKTEFNGLKKLENVLLCYMGKSAGAHCFAYKHGCCNTNLWRFSKLLTATALALIGVSIDLITYRDMSKRIIYTA